MRDDSGELWDRVSPGEFVFKEGSVTKRNPNLPTGLTPGRLYMLLAWSKRHMDVPTAPPVAKGW